MVSENEVFRKVKEISTRTVRPRPLITTGEIASELGTSVDIIIPLLGQLKQLRLLSFNEPQVQSIRLTLLGTVVNRDRH